VKSYPRNDVCTTSCWKQFEDLADFCYEEGPEFDWNKRSFQYPPDLGSAWLNDLKETSSNMDDKNLSIPDVDLSKMNSDQKCKLSPVEPSGAFMSCSLLVVGILRKL
jgi:hypothetical protein